MTFNSFKISQHSVLFWLGVLGILFYVAGPVLFPHAQLRQPELLPVYTLMMGLGQLLKGNVEEEPPPELLPKEVVKDEQA